MLFILIWYTRALRVYGYHQGVSKSRIHTVKLRKSTFYSRSPRLPRSQCISICSSIHKRCVSCCRCERTENWINDSDDISGTLRQRSILRNVLAKGANTRPHEFTCTHTKMDQRQRCSLCVSERFEAQQRQQHWPFVNRREKGNAVAATRMRRLLKIGVNLFSNF